MPFPDNRIDQSDYKARKGLSNKTYCANCKQIYYGVFYMDPNNRFICGPCVERAAEARTSASPKSSE